jgi:predicted nucleotidyltransferase component of viral defense system
MNIPLITRRQLEIINRKTLRYPLQIAEKDYLLALVMQIISQSDLQDELVFKGGTALHHCYLEQTRFSEDLDFSSTQTDLILEDLRNAFVGIDFIAIKKDYQSEATLKIETLQFTGPLNYPNSLKVEVDRLQNVLLTPKSMKYNNVWGVDFKVRLMDEREVCAEKIRAMSDRARYRDYYDCFLLVEAYRLDLDEIITYVSKKEIRKPITKANIQRNWKIVGTQQAKEMGQVFYSRKIEDTQIEDLIVKLPFSEISW